MIHPDGNGEYFEFPEQPLFIFPDGSKVRFELAGNSVFPPVPSTDLRSSSVTVNVTAPTIPASGVLLVPSTAPLKVKWDVPTRHTHSGRHSQNLTVRMFATGPVQWAQLYCSWPISAGRGSIPAVLLRELRAQLGGTGAVDVSMDMYSGEFKELVTPTSSYVSWVTNDLATTFPFSQPVLFE